MVAMTDKAPVDALVERLSGEPENVADQLQAMAGLSDYARQMHRFDAYLLAGAQIITTLSSERDRLREVIELVDRYFRQDGHSTPQILPSEVMSKVRAALTGVTGG